MTPRAYVTYFDGGFAARAIVMIRSLRRHDRDADIVALCMDETAAGAIADLADPAVTAVRPGELRDFEPRLAACEDRGRSAFYATQKPVLPFMVLSRRPDLGSIVYIDADMQFRASVRPLFEEIGDASVAISPHRFSHHYEDHRRCGTYNAGLIYWRNDHVGRQCLADYVEDCLSWCGPEFMADGRWMNQGYLNRWPDRYPGVHVIEHPGVNVAVWNLANLPVRRLQRVKIGPKPLILFHATMVDRDALGIWRVLFAVPGAEPYLRPAIDLIYRPYVKKVEAARRAFRTRDGHGAARPEIRRGVAIAGGEWPRSVRGRLGRAGWSVGQFARSLAG